MCESFGAGTCGEGELKRLGWTEKKQWARERATSRRRKSLTTMPLTRPFANGCGDVRGNLLKEHLQIHFVKTGKGRTNWLPSKAAARSVQPGWSATTGGPAAARCVAQPLAEGAPLAPSSPAHSASRPDGGARIEADSDTAPPTGLPRMPDIDSPAKPAVGCHPQWLGCNGWHSEAAAPTGQLGSPKAASATLAL